MDPATHRPEHFLWDFEDGVGTVTLNRPEKKNPLTFESYAELRDFFRALKAAPDCKVVIITGAGGNFSSGGDVFEIIGPLTEMGPKELLEFTTMTGDLVKAIRDCPQPIIASTTAPFENSVPSSVKTSELGARSDRCRRISRWCSE